MSAAVTVPHLYFHRVADRDPHYTCMSRQAFAEIVAVIDHPTITCSDAAAQFCATGSLADDAVMLSFDDGYADLLDYAVPTMLDAGVKATFFVLTERFGQRPEWRADLWATDRLDDVRLMDVTQLRELVELGFDVQLHGATHRQLDRLDERELLAETVSAAERLSDFLGRRISCFAYPYGVFDDRSLRAVAERFDAAFSTVKSHETDWRRGRHALRRSYVPPGFDPRRLSELFMQYRKGGDAKLLTA